LPKVLISDLYLELVSGGGWFLAGLVTRKKAATQEMPRPKADNHLARQPSAL
jgi:hypothetical protein